MSLGKPVHAVIGTVSLFLTSSSIGASIANNFTEEVQDKQHCGYFQFFQVNDANPLPSEVKKFIDSTIGADKQGRSNGRFVIGASVLGNNLLVSYKHKSSVEHNHVILFNRDGDSKLYRFIPNANLIGPRCASAEALLKGVRSPYQGHL